MSHGEDVRLPIVGAASCDGRISSCAACAGLSHNEFDGLTPEAVRLLDSSRTSNLYEPGQVVFYQGSPCLGLFCIASGEVVKRRADDRGHSTVLGLVHAGETLGYRSYFAGGLYEATAEAATQSRICFVDRDVVRRLLDLDPQLGLRFLRRASRDLKKSEDARIELATAPIRARLAHLLLVLKDRQGTMRPDGVLHVELPLSRQDMASMLGARPETIARTIRALEDDGVVRFEGRLALIPDLDPLLDELESTADDE